MVKLDVCVVVELLVLLSFWQGANGLETKMAFGSVTSSKVKEFAAFSAAELATRTQELTSVLEGLKNQFAVEKDKFDSVISQVRASRNQLYSLDYRIQQSDMDIARLKAKTKKRDQLTSTLQQARMDKQNRADRLRIAETAPNEFDDKVANQKAIKEQIENSLRESNKLMIQLETSVMSERNKLSNVRDALRNGGDQQTRQMQDRIKQIEAELPALIRDCREKAKETQRLRAKIGKTKGKLPIVDQLRFVERLGPSQMTRFKEISVLRGEEVEVTA
eukprot:GILJ01001283.1.p1 GENE.GILJ01001283.1~~GILJ01001283.1.p1  ORF type:complete len:276 (-),score=56.90 GILJ01001283.1:93-920(-)